MRGVPRTVSLRCHPERAFLSPEKGDEQQQKVKCHLGDCHHALVFTDCSIATPDDERRLSRYPALVWRHKARPHDCSVCQRLPAKFEVHDDRLADASPWLVCDGCYRAAYYSKPGEGGHRLAREDFTSYEIIS